MATPTTTGRSNLLRIVTLEEFRDEIAALFRKMAVPTKADRTNFLNTMTSREVCAELDIKQRTLWDWCQKKQFPFRRLGGGERGRLIFDLKEVRAWLAAQSKVTAREAIEEKGGNNE